MVQNLKDLFAKFSDESKCRDFLVQQRWSGVPTCPYCGSTKSYVIENDKRFKCGERTCYKKYSVTVGTIMHATNIPLTTWFPAMYLISAHKKGISSVQLAKDLGVTQKTAWFMMHRIRKSLQEKNSPLLTGIVEIDETYIAKKFKSGYKGMSPDEVEQFNKHISVKNNKGAVIGLIQRDGKAVIKAVDSAVNKNDIINAVTTHVSKEATLMTDESNLYSNAEIGQYNRETVTHSKGQWVNGNCHTNTVEGFWSVMKRGVYGTYHQISVKHLQRYCDEFAYRYNSRDINDGVRFTLAIGNIEGVLTYKQLTAVKEPQIENKAQEPLPIFRTDGRTKQVVQYKGGKYMCTYNSILEALYVTKIGSKVINDALKGRRKRAGGFEWKYL